MSENIVDFPLSDRPIAETDIEALHAEAFRDLENRLNDCVSMARIAADQIHDFKTDDRELVFAVAHTWELLEKLKKDYYAAWHDEEPGGLHTCNI
jgi:hypothetical protein